MTDGTVASFTPPARDAHGRASRWLLLVAAATLAVGLAVVAQRLRAGEDAQTSWHASSLSHLPYLLLPGQQDSWAPLVAASTRLARAPDGLVYRDTLQLDGCKFQYPPSALLLFELLPPPRLDRLECASTLTDWSALEAPQWPARAWIDGAARLALLGTLACVAWLAHRRLAESASAASPPHPLSRAQTAWLVVTCSACGLLYYPLLKAYDLGQVQVFIGFAVALALLALQGGQRVAAGVLIGLCALVKPQYALIVLWAALRRDAHFAAGLAGVVVVGHAAALAHYGAPLHLEYLELLQDIARHGEAFWPNQSVNGLMLRALQVADPLVWTPGAYAPYHPTVHAATLASSIAILAAGLLGRGRAPRPGRLSLLDLAIGIAACTLASPIAWEHHYNVFFALTIVALATLIASGRCVALELAVLALAHLLIACELLRPELIHRHPLRGLLGAHMWLGAMLVFGLLLVLRRRSASQATHALQGAGGGERSTLPLPGWLA